MTDDEVRRVLDALAAAGCRTWLAGEWGVDALVGHQTRPHRDVDLTVDAADEAAALRALAMLGYLIETDWRPVRVEVACPGRGWVDLHPVVFHENGDGCQADLDGGGSFYPKDSFTTGSLGGRRVNCLSVAQQIRFHRGYEADDVDLADLSLLRRLAAPGTPEQ